MQCLISGIDIIYC